VKRLEPRAGELTPDSTSGRERGVSTEATATVRRDVDAMTMYLSGRDIRPTGCEPAEFIDVPNFAPAAESGVGTPEVGDEDETSLAPADRTRAH
jgi:hypothetical protein